MFQLNNFNDTGISAVIQIRYFHATGEKSNERSKWENQLGGRGGGGGGGGGMGFAHKHILIINNAGHHWEFSSWGLKILGQISRTSTLIILKYLRPYRIMDNKLSVISQYRLNIFIKNDSCRYRKHFLWTLCFHDFSKRCN